MTDVTCRGGCSCEAVVDIWPYQRGDRSKESEILGS